MRTVNALFYGTVILAILGFGMYMIHTFAESQEQQPVYNNRLVIQDIDKDAIKYTVTIVTDNDIHYPEYLKRSIRLLLKDISITNSNLETLKNIILQEVQKYDTCIIIDIQTYL